MSGRSVTGKTHLLKGRSSRTSCCRIRAGSLLALRKNHEKAEATSSSRASEQSYLYEKRRNQSNFAMASAPGFAGGVAELVVGRHPCRQDPAVTGGRCARGCPFDA